MVSASTPGILVHHLQRGPDLGSCSIERCFEDVRAALPPDIRVLLSVNRRPNRGIWPRLAAAAAARRGRADVRHVLGDAHFLAWLLPRKRTVLTIFDCASFGRLEGWRRRLFGLLWYRWPLRRAARVTTVSEFSRREIVRWTGFPSERIVVIPLPLSPEFRPAPARPHDRWSRILSVGSMVNKNQLRLVEALAGLDLTLVTVGRLHRPVLDSIARHGLRHEAHADLSREEMVALYRDADVLLFPSTYEGFGLPIVEAQAVGRPVVTANIASMPEAAGGAACLVDPFDVADIRAGLLRVLGDPAYATKLIAAGFENARRHRADLIAARYAELYREVAGGGRG